MGDFNFGKKASLSSSTKTFQRLMRFFGFQQIIGEPTRITEHSRTLIDLLFTSSPEHYYSGVVAVGFSDHSAIFGVRKVHRAKRPPPKIIHTRNYKNYDSALFKQDLNHVPCDTIEMHEEPDEAWNYFKDIFMIVADKHVPIVQRRVRGRSLPWITPHIKDLMKDRDYHKKMAIKTNKVEHWSSYRKLRNSISMKLRKAKGSYYVTELSGKQNSKEMWKTINKITNPHGHGNKPNAETGSTNSSGLTSTQFNQYFSSIARNLCDIFRPRTLSWPRILTPRVDEEFYLQTISTEFVDKQLNKLKSTKATGVDGVTVRLLKDAGATIAKPIAFIINLSISKGKIPSEWKTAKIIPVHKCGPKTDINNYRPISILPIVSKIMERAIQIQLLSL